LPELPEVDVIAHGLDEVLEGQCIRSVELLWPGCVDRPAPDSFSSQLAGRRFQRVGRRGKFLVFDLTEPGRPLVLLIHLRMTGTVCVLRSAEPASPYVRATLHLEDDRQLRFADTRKFGRLYLVPDPNDVLGELGPEPLAEEFTPAILRERLAHHRRYIKPLLLDQTFIAGLGNIYVDEALYRAGIHPLRRSHQLDEGETCRLHGAIQSVLRAAIARRGTTFSDYRDACGERGGNQYYLSVYGRQGESCPRCGQPIERIVVGQRGTHFCPHCQPPAVA
jgi:formamidopyrimidine-DNA glycosylase